MMDETVPTDAGDLAPDGRESEAPCPRGPELPPERGGPKGPEPTRFGDWEQKGRCTDF